MRRMMSILLLMLCVACAAAESTEAFVYGRSSMGRDLICHPIGDPEAGQSLLIIFGVHGFEDAYPHDGHVLRLIAEEVVAHYTAQAESLGDCRLYIVPSANPDGLIDGSTENGFGRCNAQGMDINRDFPVYWKKRTDPRNLTGDSPFSTPEAQAIRDLVEDIQPTWAIDVHGWINASYGDGRMARTFARPFGFEVKQSVSGGMLSTWLAEVTREAIMIELPYAPNEEEYVKVNSQRLIEGIDKWLSLNQ